MNKSKLTVAVSGIHGTRRRNKQTEFARVRRQLTKNRLAMLGLFIILIEIILAVLAPVIIPYDYAKMDMSCVFETPSRVHFFGCDDMGRDIFSRVIYGSRYSLSIGIFGVAIGTCIGLIIGSIAGYFGGQVDNIIMRFLDIIQALPGMLLMIVISAVLGPGFFNTIIAMSIGSLPGIVRLLRAQILKERENEYIEACRAVNCGKLRVIISHLLPNCMSPVIVEATMGVAQTITVASALSFIGLGVKPPIPEWGAMLSAARQFIRQSPHLVFFPGLAIAVTVLALNLLGDGLRDALDPKLKN
jgi:peptide/nickel transport system permease protein